VRFTAPIAFGALAVFAIVVAPAAAAPIAGNQPPKLHVKLLTGRHVDLYGEVRIRVRVDDPDGDPVCARLELGPATMCMQPIWFEKPPVTREIRWFADPKCGGRQHVVIAAATSFSGAYPVFRETVDLDVNGYGGAAGCRALDLDGDFRPEIVAGAARLDRYATDAGAICVFERVEVGGGQTTRLHYFHAAAPAAGDLLSGQLEQADVTGDGLPDLLGYTIANGGALHVWFGGPIGAFERPDDATLTAGPAAKIPFATRALFHDVTGDGIDDLVVVAPYDSSIQPDAGAIHVFAGGSGLVGSVTPTATLTLNAPAANDHLGYVLFGDVTGDGIDDVVAIAPDADLSSLKRDCGVAAVWAGGPGLVGAMKPTATLEPPVAVFTLRMGYLDSTPGLYLVDLDADGVLDVLAVAKLKKGGEIYFWKGGSRLTGTPPADATFRDPNGKTGDWLGWIGYSRHPLDLNWGFGIQFADVTNDGLVDLIAGASRADVNGVAKAGLVHVFAGATSLTGSIAPTATLGASLAQPNGLLCSGNLGLQVVDVTADGIADVVTIDADQDVAGVADAGSIHVWAGGAMLTGSVAPTATLTVPNASPGAGLGHSSGSFAQGTLLRDVTGDGSPDLVVPASGASVDGVSRSGAIYVFETGPSLVGNRFPRATLYDSHAHDDDVLGFVVPSAPSIRIEDVTGDGIPDVISRSYAANHRVPDTGAVYVWQGGPGLAGPVATHARFYGLSRHEGLTIDGAAVQCGDVNGDGVLDLVIGSPAADVGSVSECGRGYVFAGGTGLVGHLTPTTFLDHKDPAIGDVVFSSGSAPGVVLADFDGDGRTDVFDGAGWRDTNGLPNAGAILWWPDGRPASFRYAAELFPPDLKAGDFFGY
jgi:hypothetical protein